MTAPEERQELWDTMTINENIVANNGMVLMANVNQHADRIVGIILSNKDRYLAIAHSFPNPGLKWWLVSIIHYMECTLNFHCYLGNGQPIDHITTIVPKGRGPFPTFEAGAIDAIKFNGLDKVTDWSIGNVLYILEGYNGYGYAEYHNINSPYLWSGTNQYVSGKYVSDGKYNPDAVSIQIGAAILLKKLLQINF